MVSDAPLHFRLPPDGLERMLMELGNGIDK